MEHNIGHAEEELNNFLVRLVGALEFFSESILQHVGMIVIESWD